MPREHVVGAARISARQSDTYNRQCNPMSACQGLWSLPLKKVAGIYAHLTLPLCDVSHLWLRLSHAHVLSRSLSLSLSEAARRLAVGRGKGVCVQTLGRLKCYFAAAASYKQILCIGGVKNSQFLWMCVLAFGYVSDGSIPCRSGWECLRLRARYIHFLSWINHSRDKFSIMDNESWLSLFSSVVESWMKLCSLALSQRC